MINLLWPPIPREKRNTYFALGRTVGDEGKRGKHSIRMYPLLRLRTLFDTALASFFFFEFVCVLRRYKAETDMTRWHHATVINNVRVPLIKRERRRRRRTSASGRGRTRELRRGKRKEPAGWTQFQRGSSSIDRTDGKEFLNCARKKVARSGSRRSSSIEIDNKKKIVSDSRRRSGGGVATVRFGPAIIAGSKALQ